MFRRILLWFFGTLLFSFAGYMMTSFWIAQRSPMRQEMFRRTIEYTSSEAAFAYETGGREALRTVLERQDEVFPGRHHLIEASGRDLLTGEDRSALLNQRPPERPLFPFMRARPFQIRHRTPDGRYIYLVEGHPPPARDPIADLAVYGWIVVVVVALIYALAYTLARPIRRLRDTVVRFGRGHLSSRAGFHRKDEIGELARAFDEMADRIETLLTAERRLLQDVSHELRSPLARLRFALQLARSSADPKTALARVDKEVDRLTTLVGELLQVTRAEGDPESRNLSAINLSDFLSSLVEDCRIEAQARACDVALRTPSGVTWSGDRELLHRAVENVLRNAIHHAPKGSQVEVELDEAARDAVIRIRDFGEGVAEEHLSEIFQPFYRVEEDRNRSNGGVGLGLAIAKRAVQAHNGSIRALNADPGLLVEIRLPK
jgi:two-component system sensor histidine kinase CpxA